MVTEQYAISIIYQNRIWHLPVSIEQDGPFDKITVGINGEDVYFARDEHDGLMAITHRDHFEPQFLYLVGLAVEQQRKMYN